MNTYAFYLMNILGMNTYAFYMMSILHYELRINVNVDNFY